jgi:hypothetical protein
VYQKRPIVESSRKVCGWLLKAIRARESVTRGVSETPPNGIWRRKMPLESIWKVGWGEKFSASPKLPSAICELNNNI